MKKVIVLLVLVVAITVVALLMKGDGTPGQKGAEENAEPVPTTDPIDDVSDFYQAWLDAVKSPDIDPVTAELTQAPVLTATMQAQLAEKMQDTSELDPVLCQTAVPKKIGAKLIAQKNGEAQVMVIARGEKMPGQATVTVIPRNGEWAINEIECSYGEQAPEKGEFNFEHEGQLLKSVPPPLDPDYWYLVYEVDGVMGYTAKLMFDEESMCGEQVCDPNTFSEASTAFVQGDVGEAGLMVKHLELR